MKHIKLLLVLISLLTVSGIAKSDYYLTQKVNGVNLDDIASRELANVNTSTAIFIAEQGSNKGIFSYDYATDRATFLIDSDYGAESSDPIISTGGGYALIGILGKLYFTNGDKEKTKLLGDFGYSGFNYGIYSNICSINYQNNAFYFVVGNCSDSDLALDLWTYRPQSNELNQITNGQFKSIADFVLDDHSQSGDSVFFMAVQSDGGPSEIWRTKGNKNDISFVASLPSSLYYNEPVLTSKGLFFCSYFYDNPSRLMRLSNSLNVDQITTDCANLIAYDDKIYFNTSSSAVVAKALWVSSGVVGDRRLVKSLGPPNESGDVAQGSVFPLCNIGNKLYFGYYSDLKGNQIWESGGTSETTIEIFKGENYTISRCYDNQLSLYHYQQIDNDILNPAITSFIYDVNSKTLAKVYGYGDSVFGPKVNDVFYELFYQLHKITKFEGQYTGFLPPILNIMFDGDK